MKTSLSVLILVLAAVGVVQCHCGCLKCSKDLRVVSPPNVPCTVIYRGPPCSALKPLPYTVQAPVIPPAILPKNYDYRVEVVPVSPCERLFSYDGQVQAPVLPKPLLPLTGLVTRPDRVVLPAPDCPTPCGDIPCRPLYPDNWYPRPSLQQVQVIEAPKTGPLLEKIQLVDLFKAVPTDLYQEVPSDYYGQAGCGCRYGNKRRAKRDLPILKSSVNFIMGLLPHFIRFPIEQTLKSFQYHQKIANYHNNKPHLVKEYRSMPKLVQRLSKEPPPLKKLQSKPSASNLLQKLQKLNRDKRSLVVNDNEISFPFLRVTDVQSDEDETSSEEIVDEGQRRREEFLKPLNFGHLLPQNPIFYLLNTPIRLLHHFHQFGQQITPVFNSVPHVIINSKRYFRNFGKHLKNDVLNFASNLIGDFDELDTTSYKHMKPRRYRRSLNETEKFEQFEPEDNLVFENEVKNRSKRYILKVVDEDEVEEFLRQKLGGLLSDEPKEKPKKKNKENTNKKKLVVEKLSSKLIIDNNGRPFIEINGVKRPLFLNKKQQTPSDEDKSENVEDMKDKINSLIVQAKERIDKNDNLMQQHHDVPSHIIKDRIDQILTEIQELINMDFEKYSTIHNDLSKLQNFKEFLVNDWKKILIEEKFNNMSSKIRILDSFKELQSLRDKAVQDIASTLLNGSNFMTKKLIKMLVRLQKLQCIIYRVVEDFGEKIKTRTDFDATKEIKYVDFLAELHFVVGRTRHDLEKDLRRERDLALENEMSILEKLRKLLDKNHEFYEEAKLLWEIKNIDKLQRDTIIEMNAKITRGQKIRKELKILFDLLRQLENCEEKQKKLLEDVGVHHHNRVFPHRTIIEDKKPVKLVSNGYSLTAYKVSDGFD